MWGAMSGMGLYGLCPPRVRERVLHARLPESLQPELARVAHSARLLPAEVARPRELPRDAQLLSFPDDVRLRHRDHRGDDSDRAALGPAVRPEARDLAQPVVELWSVAP